VVARRRPRRDELVGRVAQRDAMQVKRPAFGLEVFPPSNPGRQGQRQCRNDDSQGWPRELKTAVPEITPRALGRYRVHRGRENKEDDALVSSRFLQRVRRGTFRLESGRALW